MSNKWKQDLKQGQLGEKVIASYIINKRPEYGIAEFRDDKLYDVRFTSDTKDDITIECKTDRYEFLKGFKTYNIFVETSCNGNDSGITSSIADYFVYYFPDWEEAYFIQSDKLREFINNHKENDDGIEWKERAGDGERVKGICIHRKFHKDIFNVVKIKKNKKIWKD